MKDVKYLFINSRLSDGGSERVMTLLANEFANRGLDVSMLLVREEKKEIYKLDDRIDRYQLTYGNSSKIGKLIKRFLYTRRYIKKINPDKIISFMEDINAITLLACIGLHKDIIVSERNNPKTADSKIQAVIRWFIQNVIYRLAKKVVLQTEFVKECFSNTIQRKSVVISNPINPDIPLRYEGERNKEIVAVGRLNKQKNFPLLIKAFAEFVKEYPTYKLTIYGEGELRSEFEDMIKELDIESCVELPGYIQDVNIRMNHASMYVSSSDYEGISNSMIEALAMGVPSICTDCPVGGARLMIGDNRNGLLIPVGDESALITAMKDIASDEKLAKRLSNNAITIRDEYSIEKIADIWIKEIG